MYILNVYYVLVICEELCVYLRFKEDTTVKKFNIENVDDVDSKFIYIFFTD